MLELKTLDCGSLCSLRMVGCYLFTTFTDKINDVRLVLQPNEMHVVYRAGFLDL